jgi:hypothetical protein
MGYDLPTGKRNIPIQKTYKKVVSQWWLREQHHI